MAVLNGEAYLREAVDSILGQTFTDFELIIVDDGSTDRTPEILRSIRDPRVRLLTNPSNLGLARSLNLGMAKAVGEFIARQDADDVSEPDRFERQVAFLDGHPETALLGSAHTEIDAHGRVLGHVDAHCRRVTILWWMLFFCPFAHSAIVFRKQPVLEAVGGYDPSYRYSTDYEYWTRIADRFAVANLPEPLVRLRVHDASMTATYGDYTREGPRLRARAVAELLDSEGIGGDAQSTHGAISALLFGPPAAISPYELLRAADQVAPLHRAFARRWGLSANERRAHRAEVNRHLSEALLAFAHAEVTRPAGSRRAAGRLLFRAVVADPRFLLDPRRAARAVSLLLPRPAPMS
jgi:hypothetical protein